MKDRFALHWVTGDDADGGAMLRAIARSEGLAGVGCHAHTEADAGECERILRQHGFGGELAWVPAERPQELARFGTLYHLGTGIERLAWRRLGLGERRYSLCGTVHASARHADMSAIARLLVAPLHGWDALVCSSRALRDSVREILERQADYLRARLGAQRFELPQLPLIAPGVDCGALAADDARRAAARRALGIGLDDVAFLDVDFLDVDLPLPGRHSFHAGAHPQQMFSALERADKGGRQVHLILSGGFAGEAAAAAFREAAARLCPSVRLVLPDARSPEAGAGAWAAADIFTSLADSVQESAGLAARAAMAAGLPCVVSDWNGYRDVVREGVDGYRIPTVMPGAGAGLDLAQRYDDGVDNVGQYRGHIGQAVALDGALLAQAYGRLIKDAGLRRQLGESGRRRACEEFDWQVVLRRYRALWSELDERRRADAQLVPAAPAAVPDRLDPFALFASYPSAQLTPESTVELAPEASLALLREYRELEINRYAASSLPTLEEFGLIFGSIESRPTQVDELLDTLGPCDRPTLLRGLVWLCKMDLLRIGGAA